MASGLDPSRQPSSNALARRRDALILRLIARHPATAGMLVGLGLFPNRKKASKRLARLIRRGEVRRIGSVSLKDGRPEHVYARGRWKTDNLLHEVQLTRVCLKIHADEVRRGPADVDRYLLPDAELWIAGRRYCLEMDCGTMSYPDVVRKRFTKYRSCRDFTLWVCPSESRMEGLRQQAAMIQDISLFTTLDLALQNPHATIWVDVVGERGALPRGGQREVGAGEVPGDKGGDKAGSLSPPASGGATTSVPHDPRPIPSEFADSPSSVAMSPDGDGSSGPQ